MAELFFKAVEQVMDELIRPDLTRHGGTVKIVSLSDNILKVRLVEKCSTCPAVNLADKCLIESELKRIFPDLKQVVCS